MELQDSAERCRLSSKMPGFRSEGRYSASVSPTSLIKLFRMFCLGPCSGIVGCSCLPEVHTHRNKTKNKGCTWFEWNVIVIKLVNHSRNETLDSVILVALALINWSSHITIPASVDAGRSCTRAEQKQGSQALAALWLHWIYTHTHTFLSAYWPGRWSCCYYPGFIGKEITWGLKVLLTSGHGMVSGRAGKHSRFCLCVFNSHSWCSLCKDKATEWQVERARARDVLVQKEQNQCSLGEGSRVGRRELGHVRSMTGNCVENKCA